jgi:hypothetical protein
VLSSSPISLLLTSSPIWPCGKPSSLRTLTPRGQLPQPVPQHLPPCRTREHRLRPPRPTRPPRRLRRLRHLTNHDQTRHPRTTPGPRPPVTSRSLCSKRHANSEVAMAAKRWLDRRNDQGSDKAPGTQVVCCGLPVRARRWTAATPIASGSPNWLHTANAAKLPGMTAVKH